MMQTNTIETRLKTYKSDLSKLHLIECSMKELESRIRARFPEARTLTGAEVIQAWNDERVPLLLAHPASAGHGLNLQDGGNIIVWFGLTWSLEQYQQANKRLHRQGQKNTVFVHNMVVQGSMDEDVLLALQGKSDTQESLLQALKVRIRNVKGGAGHDMQAV